MSPLAESSPSAGRDGQRCYTLKQIKEKTALEGEGREDEEEEEGTMERTCTGEAIEERGTVPLA